MMNIAELRASLVENTRILIVDDSGVNRKVLRSLFEKRGFTHFDDAADGLEAMRKIEQTHPDLILLDLIMPGIDGMEVCARIRAKNAEFGNPVIIVQTAATDQKQKLQIFEMGTNDYVNKPIDGSEMVARSLSHLERRQLIEEMSSATFRMRQELNNAARLQHDIVPSAEKIAETQKKYALDIASLYKPSTELGGDFWGMQEISDDVLGIYMVDFSGHGLTAALNTFRLHALFQDASLPFDSPQELLKMINKRLCTLLPTGQYATMLYAMLDTKAQTLTYVTAGFLLPVIINEKGESVAMHGRGLPLGFMKEADYEVYTIPFIKGSKMLLFSDALVETFDEKEISLCETEVADFIATHGARDAAAQISGIAQLLKDHAGNKALEDDLTLVMIQ